MPYLGNVPAEAYTNTVKDSFNGDASTTAFTLSQPSTTNNLRVVVENVIQDPTVAYTVSGTTLTFTSAPPTGTANVYAVHLGPATMTAVPPSEINNATTYTSDLTVQGSFTSQGIDDNATSTTMTLDSSGHTMFATTDNVVQTNSGTGNGGVVIRGGSNPYLAVASDGSAAGEFNRLASDGPVVQFRKDGTTVGSIGSYLGTYLYMGSTGGVDTHINFVNGNVRPANADGTHLDGTLALGHSQSRWSDLYLSGGVYLGGTGSSNLLQDYEIGSWTPVDVNDTAYNTNSVTATYTKIGRIVYFNFDISSTGSTTGTKLGGLPFTAASSSVSNNWSVYTGYSTSNADICGHINAGTDEVNITVGSSAHTLAGRWIGAGFYYV